MKWVYRVVVPVFIVGIVAVCIVLFLQVNEAKAEIEDLNATISSQETMINKTVADLDDTKNRLQETEDTLQKTEDELLDTQESLDETIQANIELKKWNDGLWYLIPDSKVVSRIEVYW